MSNLTSRTLRAAWARRYALVLACCLTSPLYATHASLVQALDASEAAAAGAAAPVVNLNTASAEELEHLPGIGPTRARAILELRARLQRFTRVEDLLRVKGIGRATFRRLRPWLTLTGPTTLHADARSTSRSR